MGIISVFGLARASLLPLGMALTIVGCGGSEQPVPPPGVPMNPPQEDPALAEMMGEETPASKPTAAEVAEPAAPAMPPASKHTIAGVSVSEIDAASVSKAVEKAGWKADASSTVTGKLYETVRVNISADKNKGVVEITRRAKAAGTATDASPTAKEAATAREKEGAAVVLDEPGDVAVSLSWTGKDAKKLLDKLVAKK